jgi:hypothetical protein
MSFQTNQTSRIPLPLFFSLTENFPRHHQRRW